MPNNTVNRLTFKTDDKELLNKIKAEIASKSTGIDFNKIMPDPNIMNYNYEFTIYHIIYRLVDLGITNCAEDFLPRKCIGCYSKNNHADPMALNMLNSKYLSIVSKISVTLNELSKSLYDDKDEIKKEIISRLKTLHKDLIPYNTFITRYNRYDFESVVKRNSIRYLKMFLMYGVIDSFDWRIAYWNTKWNSYDTRWIDDNTLEFYTAWNPVLNIVDTLQKKYNVDLEYCFIRESMPDSPERWSTMNGCLAQDELSLEEEENLIKVLFELDEE